MRFTLIYVNTHISTVLGRKAICRQLYNNWCVISCGVQLDDPRARWVASPYESGKPSGVMHFNELSFTSHLFTHNPGSERKLVSRKSYPALRIFGLVIRSMGEMHLEHYIFREFPSGSISRTVSIETLRGTCTNEVVQATVKGDLAKFGRSGLRNSSINLPLFPLGWVSFTS